MLVRTKNNRTFQKSCICLLLSACSSLRSFSVLSKIKHDIIRKIIVVLKSLCFGKYAADHAFVVVVDYVLYELNEHDKL